MKTRHRMAIPAVALLAAGALTPATQASPLDLAAPDSYYLVDLKDPVSTDDVLQIARAHDLTVLSVQHNGPTNGELIVGDADLAEALEMYRETDLQNFGTEPHVVSFVVDTPLTGLTVAGQQVAVTEQSQASADPTPQDEGDVTAANITKPWAPRTGTLWAHNSNTGAARQMRHIMSWDSRSGLNSYNPSDAEFVYEHDTKLYDRDPYLVGAMGHQACGPDYWVSGDTRIVTSNVPSASKVYADNARASDDCGMYDVSFGIFKPWNLSVNTNYKIVVGANAGQATRSPFGMMGAKMVRSCGLDSAWCVSLGSDPREDYDMFINQSRNWKMPGCYTWYREDSSAPVSGSC
jgi:hypothetical protein